MATLLGRRCWVFTGSSYVRYLQPHRRVLPNPSQACKAISSISSGPDAEALDHWISPQVDPRFRYGDVIIISDTSGDRRLVGPLKKGGFRDNNLGRLNHDDIIGQSPLSIVKTHKGANYTLHWPTLNEYCTKVKRQASIMYPKDATTAVHLLDLFPGAHVLEAGTGNGSMTLYIQRAIQGRGSHLDTVDIKNEHSQQAEQNVERFWRGMYRPGITFWRSVGGLQKVIKHLKGEDQEDTTTSPSEFTPTKSGEDAEPGVAREGNKLVSPLDRRRAEFLQAREVLPPNPHPMGHQYDAIALDLPDCKSVLLDLSPLLKPDRPMCLYMVNMSQVLETVQWMRTHCNKYTVERVLEVEWKEWSVRSAAVRSRVRGRVNVGGQGQISHLQRSGGIADGRTLETLTTASDNIPDDAVGWICRPLHIPIGHTGFLVQLRKNLTEDF